MGDAVRGLTERLRAAGEPVHGPALFVCRHHVFGVGTFAVDAVLAGDALVRAAGERSEEHTSELQSRLHLVCRLLLEKKKHAPHRRSLLLRGPPILVLAALAVPGPHCSTQPRRGTGVTGRSPFLRTRPLNLPTFSHGA